MTNKNTLLQDAVQGAQSAEAETVCFITARLRAPRNAEMCLQNGF